MNNAEYSQDELKAIKYALELAVEIIDGMIDVEEVPEYRLIDCTGETDTIVCYGTYDEVQRSAKQCTDDKNSLFDLEIQQYDSKREQYITVEYIRNKKEF